MKALALMLALAAACWVVQPGPTLAQQGERGFVQLVVNDKAPVAFFPVVMDDGERPYLQFDALMTALEVPASFDASLGAALGFLADGGTRFEINLERRTVLVGEDTYALRADDVRIVEHQLYVLYSAVPRWLPVQLEWSVGAYEVRIRTGYPLPSTERVRREALRKALAESRAQAPTAAQLERDIPWFDPGMFELSASARGGHNVNEQGLLNLKGVQRFLKGDLEYSFTQTRVDGETLEPTMDYSRLTYYDPLHTWQVQFGDTYSAFSPLVLDTVSFRGASFYTGGQQLRYGRTTLIGTGPPGSAVDLYRQGVLLDFTVVDSRGFYRFDRVPLGVDTTLFEVHIYTPSGRTLVEFKEVAAQEEMLAQGALASLGAVGRGDQGLTRFDIGGGEVRYGVFPRLTLGAYNLQLDGYDTGFDTIEGLNATGAFGLLRPVSWLVLLAEQARDSQVPGAGTRLGAFLGFRPVALQLEQRRYTEDFAPPNRTRSGDFSVPEQVDMLDSVEARTSILGTHLELRTERGDYGQSRTSTDHRLRIDRLLTRNLSAFMTLERQRSVEPDWPTGGFDDRQLLTTYRLSILSRLELFAQHRRNVSGEVSSQVRMSWLKSFQFGSPWSYELSHILRSPEDDLSVAAVGYLFTTHVRVSLRAQSDGTWLAAVDYAVPFRVDGDGFEQEPYGTFGRAGLEGDVYLDGNANGVRDPGEGPVADATLLAPGIEHLTSDANGHFRGWGLPTITPATLELSLLSTDAMVTPAEKRTYIAARPGERVHVDVALVPSAGMDGRLVGPGGEEISPAEGLELVLLDARGDVAARGTVEWDGAFVFENVRPGTYRLQASEAFAEHGLALEPEALEVSFPPGPDPAWRSGVELHLVRVGAAR